MNCARLTPRCAWSSACHRHQRHRQGDHGDRDRRQRQCAERPRLVHDVDDHRSARPATHPRLIPTTHPNVPPEEAPRVAQQHGSEQQRAQSQQFPCGRGLFALGSTDPPRDGQRLDHRNPSRCSPELPSPTTGTGPARASHPGLGEVAAGGGSSGPGPGPCGAQDEGQEQHLESDGEGVEGGILPVRRCRVEHRDGDV
jgi:hypothetical protein